MMPAFITRRNRPSVNIVRGMVRIISNGFKYVFKNASTTATIKALVILSTWTPGNIHAIASTHIEEYSNLAINFMK